MKEKMRFGRLFFITVLLFCIFETARLWNSTPAQMASHFDFAGRPDHFATKEQFFGFEIETMFAAVGLGVLIQVLVLITPAEWVNLPNRTYWLAPERREQTVDRLSSFAATLFGIVLLGIHAGFELAAHANLHQPILFNAQLMFVIIAGLFAAGGLMLVWLAISFRVPSPHA
ncbi:MAG TPA: DUF1648 domain-containing protein [Anaerolineales bacterium]|nr:DUF1648 domain-containing protein [Anaerolineales bacterium]